MEAVVIEHKGITRRGVISLLFALICIALSYLFCCIIPIKDAPLGFFVLNCALFLSTFIVAVLTGGKLRASSLVAMVFGLIVAFYRMIHGTVSDDIFPVFLIVGASYAYFVLSLFGNASGSFGGRLLLDLVKGICSLFVSFTSMFVSIFKPEGSRRSSKNTLAAVLGVILAIVLVIIVASLLSYDSHFVDMLPKLDFETVLNVILKVMLSVPLAAMVFSLYSSSKERKLKGLSSEETGEKIGSSVRILPPSLIIIPIASVLIVYVMFFISQWAYYMSAFTHRLPDGYSVAGYAREGFFRLCVVACINTVLIIIVSCFNKRKSGFAEVIEKIIKILLSIATLVLIATAISKMLLYIDIYDLTRDRLIVTVFLVFLSAAFIMVILSTIIRRVKALPVIVVLGIMFAAAFSLINTNGIIAKYNVDMYLNGKHEAIDVAYIAEDLGYSSVPELKRLSENALDSDVRRAASEYLELYQKTRMNQEWYEISIPYLKAKDEFEK